MTIKHNLHNPTYWKEEKNRKLIKKLEEFFDREAVQSSLADVSAHLFPNNETNTAVRGYGLGVSAQYMKFYRGADASENTDPFNLCSAVFDVYRSAKNDSTMPAPVFLGLKQTAQQLADLVNKDRSLGDLKEAIVPKTVAAELITKRGKK